MPHSKLVFRTWVETVGDDSPDAFKANCRPSADLIDAVTSALLKLTETERELVKRYHFQGETLVQIARVSGRSVHKLEAQHHRALARLRKELASFVRSRYGIEAPAVRGCPVCESAHRPKIDRLLAERDEHQTWGAAMREIRARFDVVIRSPQTLVGHQKYH